MPAEDPFLKRWGGGRRHTLLASFAWAWAGLSGAAVRERNMRIHLGLGILACSAAGILPLGGGERALLLLAVALVIAGESANSALEAVVDLVSPAFDERARIAKDAAAGAVLALAVGSLVVVLAVSIPVLPDLQDLVARSWPGVLGAFVAALCAVLLPQGGGRPVLIDLALFLLGSLGVLLVADKALEASGVLGAGLLLLLAAGSAVRKRRGKDREG